MSLALGLYRTVTGLLQPLAPALLARRARAGKEVVARLGERLGRPSLPRPNGWIIWLHGASVGESLSLLPLIAALRAERPDLVILVTSGTVASSEVMAQRLPEGVLHQFAPVDAPGVMRGFLGYWRPVVLILVESELWPNLILESHANGVRLALLSARLSETSVRGWGRAPGAARRLLETFSLIQAQDDVTAAAIVALGGRDDGRLNLKAAADPLPADEARLEAIRTAAKGRPILLAASTHPGEDELALAAFAPLARRSDRPILVIVPRHPVRGEAVADLARGAGFVVARQGAGQAFDGAAPVYVADGMGELGLWFRLAAAAFIGGSLVSEVGGHNPLEPALLGCSIISGRKVSNWAELYRGLDAEGGVAWSEDAPGLTAAFDAALAGSMAGQAARAKTFAEGLRGETAATVQRLLELVRP